VSEPKTLQDVRWIDCEAPEMTEANALEVGAEIAKSQLRAHHRRAAD